eukprot:GHVT01019042.1.p2 GENE.GHVT01019042.1~~GHVT01019042.1.p2  ORF type:complete len:147 (+),score=44.18 GHVT01019042.1:190-630(+)
MEFEWDSNLPVEAFKFKALTHRLYPLPDSRIEFTSRDHDVRTCLHPSWPPVTWHTTTTTTTTTTATAAAATPATDTATAPAATATAATGATATAALAATAADTATCIAAAVTEAASAGATATAAVTGPVGPAPANVGIASLASKAV